MLIAGLSGAALPLGPEGMQPVAVNLGVSSGFAGAVAGSMCGSGHIAAHKTCPCLTAWRYVPDVGHAIRCISAWPRQ